MRKRLVLIFMFLLLFGSEAFSMESEINVEGDLISLKADQVELGKISDELARICKVEIKVSDDLKKELVSIELNKMPFDKVITRLMNSIGNNNYVMEYDNKGEDYIITRVLIGFREAKEILPSTVSSRPATVSPPSKPAQASPTFKPPVPMAPDSLQRYFLGDKETMRYYRLNSVKAMRMKEENKVWFTSKEEAERAGYLFENTTKEDEGLKQESIKSMNAPLPMRPDSLERYYVGDKETRKYYRLDHPEAMQLKSENKVWFTSKEEAERAGYTSGGK